MGRNVLDFEAHHIGKIEQGQIAHLALHLQPGPDAPDVLGLQWRFGANELAFVPRLARGG